MKIVKLIYGGFGLSHRNDGKPIFVYKSVPGDEVETVSIEQKKSFEKAVISKIVKPSKDRVKPLCPHFFECGGCEHQNIDYEKQLFWKNEIFSETLSRAKIEIKPNQIIAGNVEPYFYRNVIRFVINTNSKNEIYFSMHNFLYNNGNVEIKKCFLQSEISNKILNTFKNVVNTNIQIKKSFWQLRIREGKRTGELMVEIMTDNGELPAKDLIVNEIKEIPNVKSIYHTYSYNRDLNGLTRNLLFGSPVIFEKIGGFTFQISPESFFQTNSLGIKTLYAIIKNFADIDINETILDLYCGTGTIGIYLSTIAKKVVGIDLSNSAISDASDNIKINKIHNCEFIADESSHFLSRNKDNFDVIILDPPRSGLNNRLISLLCKKNPKRIIYVSCNPSTFARDIKEFEKNNWYLNKVQPIDMFPQTHHIECVGIIKPKTE